MMLRFSTPALSEVEEIRDWYEGREAGLGDVFLSELAVALENVEANAEGCPQEETNPSSRDVRRRTLRRFPYRVIFEVQGDRLLVLAVAHHRREPGYWRNRLQDK